MIRFVVFVFTLTGFCSLGAAVAKEPDFFRTELSAGNGLSDVFSIASSITAEGFDTLVSRNGGSADYRLLRSAADGSLTFDLKYLYDGNVPGDDETTLKDEGSTVCVKTKCDPSTDASGLVYNKFLWGTAPQHLAVGSVWKVVIPQSWELGPAATQTVTVLSVDDAHATITLQREGTASGAFANEAHQIGLTKNGKKIQMDVAPGEAHWKGITVFRKGIIVSDELLVVRHDELHSEETGSVKAVKRRYMLLNAAPYPTL